eukprot:749264-Hanusia_phi.AAC.5
MQARRQGSELCEEKGWKRSWKLERKIWEPLTFCLHWVMLSSNETSSVELIGESESNRSRITDRTVSLTCCTTVLVGTRRRKVIDVDIDRLSKPHPSQVALRTAPWRSFSLQSPEEVLYDEYSDALLATPWTK